MTSAQLLKSSVLAAAMICAGTALAGRASQPDDSLGHDAPSYQGPELARLKQSAPAAEINKRTAKGKSTVAKHLVCSRGSAADDGSGPNTFAWLLDLSGEAFPVASMSPIEGIARALPVRASSCLELALTGETPPVNSRSMQDIIDHCGLLETVLPPGYSYQPVSGQASNGLSRVDLAANPQLNQRVYPNYCTSCHGRY